jgi:hypothetical protein
MSLLPSSTAVALAVTGLLFHAPVQAQDVSSPVRAFISAGGGLGSHGTLYASVSLSHRTGDYILRGAQAFDLDFGIDLWGGSDPGGGGWNRELTEGALLYGRRARPSWGWARVALGVGYIDAEQLSPVAPGETPATSAIGLAAQADVAWTPNSWLGLGLTGVGNFNDLRSFAALTLSIHLGRSR